MKSKENKAKIKTKTVKQKNKRGITLISLIVTIIVLLLLTGIPIVMIVGEDGIIQKSYEAKHIVEKAEEQKDLDLKLSEYVLEKKTTDIEIGDFVDRLENQGKVKDHTQNDDGSYDIETDDGYSAEVRPDPNNPGDTIVEVEGKTNELKPKITALYLSSTTNSVTVRIKLNIRKKQANYRILYKAEKGDTDEGEYKQAKNDILEPETYINGTELTYTIQDLEQTTKYFIKIEATNDVGITTKEDSIETKEMPSAEDKTEGIEFSNLKWDDKTHKASIDANKRNENTEYTIRYRIGAEPDKDNFENLEKGGTISGLSLYDDVYVKLWDGTNYGKAATIKILDDIAPEVKVAIEEQKTSKITVKATAKDKEAGLEDEVEFRYYLKKKNNAEEDYQLIKTNIVTNAEITSEQGGTPTENTYTFENLTQNTDYQIKVEVDDIDKNNIGKDEIEGRTTGLPDAGDASNGIRIGNPEWNPDGTANIPVQKGGTTANDTDILIQYKIGENGEWTDLPEDKKVPKVNLGEKVYLKYIDRTNESVETTTILKDPTAPDITITTIGTTTSTITVKTNVTDKEAGLPEEIVYKYYLKKHDVEEYESTPTKTQKVKRGPDVKTSSDTCIFEELQQTTEYDIKVTVDDRTPNTGEGETRRKTETVPDGTGNIILGNPVWYPKEHKATVQVSTQKNFKIRYWTTKDREHKEIGNGEIVTVTENDTTVYAELWDGTNASASTSAASMTVTDKIGPTITTPNVTTTTKDINVTTSATDDQFGMKEETLYEFYIKKVNDDKYPDIPEQTSTNGTCTFTEKDQSTEYKIKIKVSDYMENPKEIEIKATTNTVPAATDEANGITISDPKWDPSAHNASVTISKKKASDSFIIEYSTDGNTYTKVGDSSVSTYEVKNISDKTTVYARLTDGHNSGKNTQKLVSDTNKPSITVTCSDVKSNSIKVTAKATDTESGMKDQITYRFYKSTVKDTWSNAEQTNTNGTCTFTDLTQNTPYYIKVEAEDFVGNTGIGKSEATTLKIPTGEAGLQFSQVTWSEGKGNVTVSKTTAGNGYKIQYSTDGASYLEEPSETHTFSKIENKKTVYARLFDGNNFGDSKQLQINDTTTPTITISNITPTTRTIAVTVAPSDEQTGIEESSLKYSIKKKDEADANYKSFTPSARNYTFSELDHNTDYTIKVEVKDKAGNENYTTTTLKTLKVPDANDTTNGLKFGTVTWEGGKAKVTVNKMQASDGFILEYSTNNSTYSQVDSNGSTYTFTNLSHGATVYARLSDGRNHGNSLSQAITDTSNPTVQLNLSDIKSNQITATTTASDTESGINTNSYKYSIKEGSGGYQVKAEANGKTNYTFTGLKQGTSYTIKVEVTDNASHTVSKEETKVTLTIPGTGIAFGATEWSGGKGRVVITSSNTTYKLRYWTSADTNARKDISSGATTDYVPNKTVIYAALFDGTQYGSSASITIDDTTNPTVSFTYSVKTNAITVNIGTAQDDQTGLGSSPKFSYYIKGSTDGNWGNPTITADKSHTFSGLTHNTAYSIRVDLSDVANNTGSSTQTITTLQMPDANSGSGLTIGAESWSGGKATVRVSKKVTNDGYHIQYRESSSATWRDGGAGAYCDISNLSHGTTVSARLWDGNNNGNQIDRQIKDGTNPNVTVHVDSVTTNSLNLSFTVKDDQSGVPQNPSFTIQYQKSGSQTWSSTTSTGSLQGGEYKGKTTLQSLQTGTYNLKVSSKDVAGNTGEATGTGTTENMPGSSAITFGAISWIPSTHKATVVINSTAAANFEIYYGTSSGSINKKILSGQSTEQVDHNATIYAQLYDGVNRSNSATTTISDKDLPNAANINITTMNIKKGESMNATVTQTDNQSGVKIEECRWALTQTKTDLGKEASKYSGKFNKESGDTISQVLSTKGTYYLHVLTVDYAGNKRETISTQSVTVKGAETASDLKDQVNGNDNKGSNSIIGSEVTGVDTKTLARTNKWRIFDVDENNIYLIAEYYIHLNDYPNGKGGHAVEKAEEAYGGISMDYVGFESVAVDYNNGDREITDQRIKNLNSDWFSKYVGKADIPWKAVAYMLDINVWTAKFMGNSSGTNKVEYVIGGPSIEQIIKSYNKKYRTNYSTKVVSEYYDWFGTTCYAYRHSSDGSTFVDDTEDEFLNRSDKAYVGTEFDQASSYRVSSPGNMNDLVIVRYNGEISRSHWGNYNTSGCKPVICLKSGVGLEKQSDGTYKIAE